MGSAASKQLTARATTVAASASASTAHAAQTAPRGATATRVAVGAASPAAPLASPPEVIKTTLSREDVLTLAAGLDTRATTQKMQDVIRHVSNARSAEPVMEIIEMKDDLLEEMKRFQDYDKVEYLQHDDRGFDQTASSYRPRSAEPIALPTDRTANAASGTFVETMPGRVTSRDLRQVLRLHYEDPAQWTSAALAAKYGMAPEVMAGILAHVGPPNVIKPLGPSENPIGIWFESPEQAARLFARETTPQASTPTATATVRVLHGSSSTTTTTSTTSSAST